MTVCSKPINDHRLPESIMKSGYPRSWFVSPVDKYLCGFCLNVLCDPHQCKKGHMYCKVCIETALTDGKITRCPSCKLAPSLKYLERNPVVKRDIDNLIVRCKCSTRPLKDGEVRRTCMWTGTLSEMLTRADCVFSLITCVDCSEKLAFTHMNAHTRVCANRKVKCGECGQTVPLQDMTMHTLDECPQSLVSCPLYNEKLCTVPNCGGTVIRCELADHLAGQELVLNIVRQSINTPISASTSVQSPSVETTGIATKPTAKRVRVELTPIVRCVTPTIQSSTVSPSQYPVNVSLNTRVETVDDVNQLPLLVQTFHHFQYGHNVMHYYDGSCYDGNWLHGMRSGYGGYTFSDGGIYMGQWLNDVRHGYGELRLPDGYSYVGYWQYAKRHGQGTEILPNGNSYNGDFQHDKPHGVGTCLDKYGAYSYAGSFVNGLKHGQGVLFHFDGRVERGEFYFGTLIKHTT